MADWTLGVPVDDDELLKDLFGDSPSFTWEIDEEQAEKPKIEKLCVCPMKTLLSRGCICGGK